MSSFVSNFCFSCFPLYNKEKGQILPGVNKPLDLYAIRDHFPGLKRPEIFLDNPAGTLIVQKSRDRITDKYAYAFLN